MIYQLVKRDPAWKALPFLVCMLVLGVVVDTRLPQIRSLANVPLYVMLLASAMMASQTEMGEDLFLGALPVSAKEIFLSRTAAMMALVWLPGLIAAGACVVLGKVNPAAFIVMSAVGMLAGVVFQSLAMRGIRVPFWAGGLVFLCAGGHAVYSDLNGSTISMRPVSLICAFLTAAILVWTWNGIPFEPARALSVVGTRTNAVRPRRFPWWLFSWFDAVVLVVIMFSIAATGPWTWGLLYVWALPSYARTRTLWLDSLPVGRRLLLVARITPCLIGMVAGYLAGVNSGLASFPGWSVFVTPTQQWPPLEGPMAAGCRSSNVEPPPDHWIKVNGGSAPLIAGPAGETFRPPVVRIYGFNVYNPYAVGCGNSQAFFSWQHERAILAVYGHKVTPTRGDAPPVLRTQIVTVGVILSLALLAMTASFINDWWRFRRLSRWVRRSVLSFFVAAGCFFLATAWPRHSLYGWPNAIQWVSWALPGQLVIVTFAAIAIPLAIYLVMERLFMASELVNRPRPALPGNYN